MAGGVEENASDIFFNLFFEGLVGFGAGAEFIDLETEIGADFRDEVLGVVEINEGAGDDVGRVFDEFAGFSGESEDDDEDSLTRDVDAVFHDGFVDFAVGVVVEEVADIDAAGLFDFLIFCEFDNVAVVDD